MAASLVISGLMLWLAIRSIDLRELGRVITSASMVWIIVATACYWIELMFRVERWRLILAPVKDLSYGQVANVLLVGYAANNVLPAKLGELFRADFIGRKRGISRLSAVGTIVIERAFDMAAVTVCAAIGALLLLKSDSSLMSQMLTAIITVGTVIGLAFVGMYAMNERVSNLLPKRFAHLMWPVVAITRGLNALRRPRLLAALTGLSAVIWFCNGLVNASMLFALGIAPDLPILLLLIGVAGIAAAIPSAPANLGTLQFAYVTVLGAMHYSPAAGFAAAFLIQVFCIGTTTVVGAVLYTLAAMPGPRRGDDAAT